jgi:hypothetical protein
MCFDLGQMDVRNEFFINNAKSSLFMEAIPLATQCVCMWSYLQSTEKREVVAFGSNGSGDGCSKFI